MTTPRNPDSNGSTVNGALTAADDGPPWLNVTADRLIDQLQRQLVAQTTEMAAMRAYIDQLHQALQAAAVVPQENPAPVA